jgi:beta-phosphoglucomutase-like phosphatase (HAD superfamily)
VCNDSKSTTPSIGIIFDCDGTLLDSMKAWHGVDDRLAAKEGFVLTKEDRDELNRRTLPECSVYLHEKLGVGRDADEVRELILDDMRGFYRKAQAKPGVHEFVEGLARAGVPMSVASTTPPELLRIGLDAAGLTEYFKAIVSAEDVGASKREPVVYDVAREPLGTTRAQTWGFEDALYAARTLEAAGYKLACIYDTDHAGTREELQGIADFYIESFEDLTAESFLKLATR